MSLVKLYMLKANTGMELRETSRVIHAWHATTANLQQVVDGNGNIVLGNDFHGSPVLYQVAGLPNTLTELQMPHCWPFFCFLPSFAGRLLLSLYYPIPPIRRHSLGNPLSLYTISTTTLKSTFSFLFGPCPSSHSLDQNRSNFFAC